MTFCLTSLAFLPFLFVGRALLRCKSLLSRHELSLMRFLPLLSEGFGSVSFGHESALLLLKRLALRFLLSALFGSALLRCKSLLSRHELSLMRFLPLLPEGFGSVSFGRESALLLLKRLALRFLLSALFRFKSLLARNELSLMHFLPFLSKIFDSLLSHGLPCLASRTRTCSRCRSGST
jgi:hypothetical protein